MTTQIGKLENDLFKEKCDHEKKIEDFENGEIVCQLCGIVIDKIINMQFEMKAYGAEEREERSRTGPPRDITRHDKGLGSVIDKSNWDIRRQSFNLERKIKAGKLRAWHLRTRYDNKERSLVNALSDIARITDHLHLPPIVKERSAKDFTEKAKKKGIFRGRPMIDHVSAIVYAQTRNAGYSVSLNQIAAVVGTTKKRVGRVFRHMNKIFPDEYVAPRFEDTEEYRMEIKQKASQIASKSGVSEKVLRDSYEIIDAAKKYGITIGKHPTTLASAALYFSGVLNGEKKTQKEIAIAAGVTEVSVRSRYKELIYKIGHRWKF